METELRCYTCGKSGHIARNCFARPNPAAARLREKEEQIRELQDELKEIYVQCDESEYEMDEPLEVEETEVKAAACQPMASKPTAKLRMSSWSCQQHNRVQCSQCFEIPTPTHHSQAFIAICQQGGLHHPVVADESQVQNMTQQLPVTDGTVKGKPVSVRRGTLCSTVVVRRSLVPDGVLTGQKEDCILID